MRTIVDKTQSPLKSETDASTVASNVSNDQRLIESIIKVLAQKMAKEEGRVLQIEDQTALLYKKGVNPSNVYFTIDGKKYSLKEED